MNIAFIQVIREDVSRPDTGISIGYLKSYLEHHFGELAIVKLFLSDSNFQTDFKAQDYDLIGISSASLLYEKATEIACDINKNNPKAIVVIGGPHISSCPESLRKCFDIGVLGEGEITIKEICDLYLNKQDVTIEDLKQIKGIAFFEGDRIIKTPRRELLPDIDSVPMPDRSLFQQDYIPTLLTSRGCPYSCDFCTSHLIWERKVRKHSNERVLKEILSIRESDPGVAVIVIRDDIFVLNRELIDFLVEEIPKHSILRNLEFSAYTMARLTTPDLLQSLKKMGFKKLNFGIESGSERILDILKCGVQTVEMNQRALDAMNEYEIQAGGNFILGVPEETEDDIKKSYEFVIENVIKGKLFTISNTILTAYPGTRYFYIFIEKNNIKSVHEINWDIMNGITSFNMAYQNHLDNSGQELTVSDWYKTWSEYSSIYIGGVELDRFLRLLEIYEPPLLEAMKQNLVKDHSGRRIMEGCAD